MDLKNLLQDTAVSDATKAQARVSIQEVNTAINVIDKAPVLKDAFTAGLLMADIVMLGDLAVTQALTTKVVKEFIAARTKAEVPDEIATKIANNIYREGTYGGIGSTVVADAAGGVKNPLLADSIQRNGDRLLLNQGSTPTCGANSCGMVLDTMGRPVDVATLIQTIPPTERGILPSQVATLMKSHGVDATAFGGRNVSDLARYTQSGTPVVVRVADSGVSDFSTLSWSMELQQEMVCWWSQFVIHRAHNISVLSPRLIRALRAR